MSSLISCKFPLQYQFKIDTSRCCLLNFDVGCICRSGFFTAVMVNCLRMCLECVQGPSFFGTNHVRLHDVASICLDSERSGENVVLLKDCTRICGSGASLCTAPLLQDNSYFEIKIQQAGSWGVGIASPDVDLNRIPLGKDMKSCVLRCDGKVYRNDQVVCEKQLLVEEGDHVRIAYNHIDLQFAINDSNDWISTPAMKGVVVFPVVYADDGAIIDVSFSEFNCPPPDRYQPVLLEQSLFIFSLVVKFLPLSLHTYQLLVLQRVTMAINCFYYRIYAYTLGASTR
ncbi:SPRY domain protein [Trichinella nativa]|uniref:SPRY domain protein n=1 Tax=Trichinella nativa TaxID=6335 RepID=A0A1Y3ECX1_9BILA|nr:SPRY domain protein [Trichinella nativa]